jgi:hypothetical protein
MMGVSPDRTRMALMHRGWARFRAVALLATGSIIVHELRYVVSYGHNASEALTEQGHSYMPFAESLALVLLTIASVRFGLSLARARLGTVSDARPPAFTRLWLAASGSLAAIYTAQEGFEGAFAPGHPSGLIGIFGHGGWTALIFSLLLGAVIALLTGVAHSAIELVARQAASRSRRAGKTPHQRSPGAPALPRLEVLAVNLAGRAPPALSG